MSASRFYPLAFLLLGMVAYLLPWVSTPSTSLSLGAYDLAEWVSLHPAARMAAPPLLPVLLLRLALVCLLLTSAYSPLPRFLKAIIVIIGAIALLPPFEFFGSGFSDSNYRQQFALALLMLLVGLVGAGGFLQRWSRPITIGLALALVITSVWGNVWGYNLMLAYRLPTQVAFGGGLLVLLAVAWIALNVHDLKQTR